MSLRAVRSPEAPKITATAGSGTLGSRASSRRTSAESCVPATDFLLPLLGVLCARLLDRVPAELAAQGRDDLHGEGVVLTGGKASEERACDSVGGHVFVYRFEDRPATLAGVLDVAADAAQVGVPLEGSLGELQEPATDDAALVPHMRDGAEVEIVLALLHDLEPFGVGLEHGVLDPVVDHLDEVPGSGAAHVGVAVLGGEGLQGELYVLVGVPVAADHEAVADLEAPDPTARTRVQKGQSPLAEHLRAADGVAEVGVAAVYEDVALVHHAGELEEGLLRNVPGGDHRPDHTRRREHLDHLLHRVGALGPLGDQFIHRPRRTVAGDDAVLPAAYQATYHVRPHPAQAVKTYLHLAPFSRKLSAISSQLLCPSCSLKAESSRLTDDLPALVLYPLQQLVEGVGELRHTLLLQHFRDALVVYPGLFESHDERPRLVQALLDRASAGAC